MIARRLPTLSRWFMAGALGALVPFLAPPFLLVAIAVLALRLSLIPGRSAPYELFVVLLNALSLPVVASSIWPTAAVSLVLALPALPWLEATLRRAGASFDGSPSPLPRWSSHVRLPGGRDMSPYLVSLTAGLPLAALVGLLTGNSVIVASSLVLFGSVWALVALAYVRVPGQFLLTRTPTARVLARDTVDVSVTISARKPVPLRIFLGEPNSWTTISPTNITLDGDGTEVHIKLTPPLAGPSTVYGTAQAVDPWGLTVAQQNVELAHLRVIPRRGHAAWLARRYLEEAQRGALAPVTAPEAAQQSLVRRGLDYYGARPYEPGDGLKDLFWKHTLKLQQYIVKERRDDRGEPVLIAANLTASDAEEADWLAYRLLSCVLTMARESVPLAFAAYTESEVVRVTPPLSPRAAVRAALELIERILIVPQPVRVLEAADPVRLRRTISRLMEAGTDPATRLARILSFEYRALQNRARVHPASRAIRSAIAELSPPVAVLLVSANRGEDAVFKLILERLRPLGVHVLQHPPAYAPRASETRGVIRPARPTAATG